MLLPLLALLQLPDTLSTAERAAIGASIVYVSERSGSKDVRMTAPTAHGDRPLLASRYDEFPAAVSPDGRLLAAVTTRDSAGRHYERLTVVRLPDAATRHFALGIARARNPSWSPDGRWLAVETDTRGFADIVRVPVSFTRPGAAQRRAAAPRPLTHAPQGSFEPAVSPRGDRIAFVTSRDGDAEVYVMRADGSDARRLTAFHRDDWSPVWSPDGRRIAFLSAREGMPRIFVVGADGTGLRALARGADAGEESAPAWSPDGQRIAYVARAKDERARIWMAELRTGERRPLTPATSASTDPAWSPDGRYLAFTSDRSGDAEIHLMRADGSRQTRLTRAKGADWLPRWAATAPAPPRSAATRP